MSKYLDGTGLATLWTKIKNTFVAKETGKGLSESNYTSSEKTKLGNIAAGAEVNQNAFTSISDGTSTINAAAKTDTLQIVGGTGASVTYDSTNKKITVNATGTQASKVTQAADGLMSKEDKTKLDGFGDASTYALKSDLTNVYKYKGSVATVANLPSTGQTAGDVYNVEERGINYAWNGTVWDALGELFAIDSIPDTDITALT